MLQIQAMEYLLHLWGALELVEDADEDSICLESPPSGTVTCREYNSWVARL
jgi:hypothetical protein